MITADETLPKLKEALQHLVLLLGIAQTPHEQWGPHDRQILREARRFVVETEDAISGS